MQLSTLWPQVLELYIVQSAWKQRVCIPILKIYLHFWLTSTMLSHSAIVISNFNYQVLKTEKKILYYILAKFWHVNILIFITLLLLTRMLLFKGINQSPREVALHSPPQPLRHLAQMNLDGSRVWDATSNPAKALWSGPQLDGKSH